MEDIFYSEEWYPIKHISTFVDKEFFYYLCDEQKIEIYQLEDCKEIEKITLSEKEYKIKFTNYCGYLNKELTHLVIPKKLIDLWGLNPYNKEKLKEDFNKKFENFLWKVLNDLGNLGLLFNLSPASFPVEETPKEENLIFQILVLLEFVPTLEENLGWIIADPHRELIKRETYKPIEEVNELEPAVVVDIVQNPHRWVESSRGFLKGRNKRFAPTEVLQFEYIETHDTVENRFIKRLLEEILFILDTAEGKYKKIPPQLVYLKETIGWYLQTTFLREVGSLKQIPSHSKVLQRKPGYRELFKLWRLLHTSFVPSFYSKLELVFALKDMATLWEYYVLTVLLRELKEIYGPFEVEIDFESRKKSKTLYEFAKFRFSKGGLLYFQPEKKDFAFNTLPLRPDFLFEFENNRLILDAKFRFFEGKNRSSKLEQLYKYKGALNPKGVVAIAISKDKSTQQSKI
ncbi:MAG: DUF2357 domain-containing protein, partial [Aquificae bacterium]|nr:DUF2357 domain-containing protein [Aquificota bacterium]